MRQNRRAIEDLFFLLFKEFTIIETRKRKLLRYNNAFNSFRVIIINLSLEDGNAERAITKKSSKNRTSINRTL